VTGSRRATPCATAGEADVGVDVDLARVGELDDASPMALHGGVGIVGKPEGVHLGCGPVPPAAGEGGRGS
jgi:hypothetical protein